MQGEKKKKKHPGRFIRVADSDVRIADFVGAFIDAFDFSGLERKRVRCDQHFGIRPALEFDGAADVVEDTRSGIDVVGCIVGFDMLVIEIELDVAADTGDVCLFVVIEVVAVETLVLIAKLDITLVFDEIALLASNCV